MEEGYDHVVDLQDAASGNESDTPALPSSCDNYL